MTEGGGVADMTQKPSGLFSFLDGQGERGGEAEASLLSLTAPPPHFRPSPSQGSVRTREVEILVFQNSQGWLWHYEHLEGRAPGPAGLRPLSPASGAWGPPPPQSPATRVSALWLAQGYAGRGRWLGVDHPGDTDAATRGDGLQGEGQLRTLGQCQEAAGLLIAALQGGGQVGLGIKQLQAGAWLSRGERSQQARPGRPRPAGKAQPQGARQPESVGRAGSALL